MIFNLPRRVMLEVERIPSSSFFRLFKYHDGFMFVVRPFPWWRGASILVEIEKYKPLKIEVKK